MIRQLAIPVKRRIAAPIKIANVEVSPIEPGKILLELAYIFASVYVINWE